MGSVTLHSNLSAAAPCVWKWEAIRDQVVFFFWEVHTEYWLAPQERELLRDALSLQAVTLGGGARGEGMRLSS